MPAAITTARILYLAELQDRPSRILDHVISAWLGDRIGHPDLAPCWTGLHDETMELVARVLPHWGFLIGETVNGGFAFTVEPLPEGRDGHLWRLEGVDPVIRSIAEPDGKHLCVAMVEAIFRARLLLETSRTGPSRPPCPRSRCRPSSSF